jgi:uncharacterized integral membrane protein
MPEAGEKFENPIHVAPSSSLDRRAIERRPSVGSTTDFEFDVSGPRGIEGESNGPGEGTEVQGPHPKFRRPFARRTENYRHTRTSAAWVGIAIAVLFGVALIDFIAQNTRNVRIEFFTTSGRIPIAVALLAAALAGAIVVLAVGISRVVQLRLNLRRQRHVAQAQERAVGVRGHDDMNPDNDGGGPLEP